MSFSLKYLFAIVAIAAIFAAAFIYRTPLWASLAINTALVLLLAATTGVLLRRLNWTFWIPFCLFGLVYLLLSFTSNNARISYYLPGFQLSNVLSSEEYAALEDMSSHGVSITGPASPYLGLPEVHRLSDILNAICALFTGTLAGVISSVWLRDQKER
jgi:hypothetical protein